MTARCSLSSIRPAASVRLGVLLALLSGLSGCFGGSRELRPPNTPGPDDFVSSLPPVSISSTLTVHSPHGDLVARLPSGWVLVDPVELELGNVFAVGCDPRYTMSIVFREMIVDDEMRRAFRRQRHIGLAETSFQRRQWKVGGTAMLRQQIEQFSIGRRTFSAYSYTVDSARTITRVAVFVAGSHVYECAITQLTFSGDQAPDQRTLTDIHQLVLGTIEW